MKFKYLFTSPKSIFQYRNTNPLFALFQTFILFFLTLILPVYTLVTYPNYVKTEVDIIRDYMFYEADETTCKIESYILTCDPTDETQVLGYEILSDTNQISDEEQEVTYTIQVVQQYNSFAYVFMEDRLEYQLMGVAITSNSYMELGLSELNFEDLRHSYSDQTYELVTEMITKHYELNKFIINIVTVFIFVGTLTILLFALIFVLTILLWISNSGQVKAKLGSRISADKLVTMACYSLFLPLLVTGLLYMYTKVFAINLWFISSFIVGMIAINNNRKKTDGSN